MKKTKPRYAYRSSITGKFVNPLYAAMFPQYTMKETIRKK